MRSLATVLLAVALSACAGPSPSGPSPTASLACASIADPSADTKALAEVLPTCVNGVPTSKRAIGVATRDSPRVFLKVVARLGKKPPDAEVAVAFWSTPAAASAPSAQPANSSVYAVRVAGITGSDILHAFLVERQGAAIESAPPPTLSVGGKEAIRIGSLAGGFLYASADAFFYVDCPDERTAAEVLQQLP
jgi:hypothetical protein